MEILLKVRQAKDLTLLGSFESIIFTESMTKQPDSWLYHILCYEVVWLSARYTAREGAIPSQRGARGSQDISKRFYGSCYSHYRCYMEVLMEVLLKKSAGGGGPITSAYGCFRHPPRVSSPSCC